VPRFVPHPERRVAVVTGASSGIGAAAAKSLAAAGHPVVLGARRTDRLDELAAAIRSVGGEAATAALDLTDDASIDAFAKTAQEAFGPVDVVVSNAGDVHPESALGVDPDDFVRAIQINLTGAHRLISRLGRPMVEAGHGDLVFVTSDVVVRQRTHMAGYVAAKSGLEGLARAMQMELEGTGVRAHDGATRAIEHRAGHHLERGHGERGDAALVQLGPPPSQRVATAPGDRRRDHLRGGGAQGDAPDLGGDPTRGTRERRSELQMIGHP
jgi:NAD(P)-dependent dehydrogenase (short-subunit alcohol dehydrogenase family)